MAAGRARLGRIVLVGVTLLLAWSAISPALDWIHTRGVAAEQEARLADLRQTQRDLRAERSYLKSERGIVLEARELNMVREGERTYQVKGLPRR